MTQVVPSPVPVQLPQPAGDILNALLQYSDEEGSSPGAHSEAMAWAVEN